MFEKGIIEKIGSVYVVYDYNTFIHRMLDYDRKYVGNYSKLNEAIAALTYNRLDYTVKIKKLKI